MLDHSLRWADQLPNNIAGVVVVVLNCAGRLSLLIDKWLGRVRTWLLGLFSALLGEVGALPGLVFAALQSDSPLNS